MKKNLKVGFVGLTHLGLTYLAASSEKGFKVIGIDFNQNKINQLKKFDIEYKEPDLQKTIFQNKRNILFSSNLKNLMDCNIVFISQDISTNDKGKGDFKSLKKLINSTFKFLNKKSVLVILSQVQPGFTRLINFDHTRLYYQVETLIFGNALERALTPERIIIGCESSESKINRLLLNYLDNYKCPIIRMKYESAELTKISINLLLASSITTTNMLAQACEKVSADWYEIIPALQLDQRIGRKAYIRPGLGISGGNVERDIGSIEKMKEDFINAGIGQFGSGWCWLVLNNGKLEITKTPNGENPIVHGHTPLLGCDVWEHSYYVDYRNRRPDYLKAFLDSLVNWEFVASQLD